MNSEIQKLFDFSKAIAVPLYNTDAIKWPIRSGHIISQVGDLYAIEYMHQLKELANRYDPSYWNKAIPSSLSIWRMAHHIINGLERAQINKETIAHNCLLMINIIETITNQEEIYSESHLILSPIIVNNLCTQARRITDLDKISELLSLATLLWAYAESLYFQGREICCEYHGPYFDNNGIGVIVRDFQNFTPFELWPEQDLEIQCHRIRIVTFHNKNLSITIDAYNNVNIPRGNFMDSCVGGLLFVDDIVTDEAAIPALLETFSRKLVKQLKYVNSMNDQSLYLQYLKIFWYRKKQLADFLFLDWRPPESAIDRILHAEIKQNNVNKYKTHNGPEAVAEQYNYAKFL